MRPSFGKMVWLVTVALFLIPVIPGAADEDPAAVSTLKLIKLKTKGFSWQKSALDIVGTSKKTLVVIAKDEDKDSGATSLKIFKMKSRGKVLSSAYEVMPVIGWGDATASSTLWIGDYKTGYGLLFVFYVTDYKKGPVKLIVAKFDADGKLTSAFKTLLKLQPPENRYFNSAEMKTGVNDGNIGVALATKTRTEAGNPTIVGDAYFLQTDLKGKVTHGNRKIVLPNGGTWRAAAMSTPTWNGKLWVVGMRVAKWQPSGGGGAIRSGAIVMAVAVTGKGGSLKPKTIFDLNSTLDFIHIVHLLPRPDAPATITSQPGKKDYSLYLIYQYQKTILSPEREIDPYSYTYYLQKLSARGKKSGPQIVSTLPAWNRTTTYNENNSYYTSEEISASINYNGDEVVMAVARSLDEEIGSTTRYEQEVDLVTINRTTGVASLLSRKNSNYRGSFLPPTIKRINGKITLLVNMWTTTKSGGLGPYEYYYSKH